MGLFLPKEDDMDPITTAIVAALSAGAVSGATKVGEQAISEAYSKIKELLGKKFGAKSKVVKAVKELEANPKSAARKEVVKEEVAAVKADQDQELLKIAQSLLKNIKALPGGTQIIQTAIGDQNIQIAGDSNTVNVGTPKKKK
jgi:beta-glucosidase-like glycosyl hydrolase